MTRAEMDHRLLPEKLVGVAGRPEWGRDGGSNRPRDPRVVEFIRTGSRPPTAE